MDDAPITSSAAPVADALAPAKGPALPPVEAAPEAPAAPEAAPYFTMGGSVN